MRSSVRIVVLLSFAAATAATAQAPMPRRPEAGPPAAEMLLSQTGELELSDAQVVRLAAIARRSEARRRALRASMDSARARFGGQPADSVARRQFEQRMQADMQRAAEQMRTELRDAIAVLTADQQAKAWNRVANRGPRMRGSRGVGEMDRLRRGMGNRMRPPRPNVRERRFRDERGEQMRPPRPAELETTSFSSV